MLLVYFLLYLECFFNDYVQFIVSVCVIQVYIGEDSFVHLRVSV
jgi:hypothetical protein